MAMAMVMVGCGSGSDSTSSSTTGVGTRQETTPVGSNSQPTPSVRGASKGGRGEKREPSRGTGEEFGRGDPYSAPKGSDNSVQVYGDEAGAAERAEVTKAMFAYFGALATLNYPKACSELSEVTKDAMERFMKAQHESGGCTSLLKKLHIISPSGVVEAKKAAEGSVGHVRIGEGNAFVLFTPAGGKPSYFAMKEEAGAWKAVSASAGSPLVP